MQRREGFIEKCWDFDGAALPSEFSGVVSGDATVAVKGSGGAQVGEVDITIAATSEAEVAYLYQGDKLTIPIARLQAVEFTAKIASSMAAAGSDAIAFAIGLISAFNSTLDSVTALALFRKKAGASNLLTVETDDNTVDKNDIATGVSVQYGSYQRFLIDFQKKSDVKFYVHDGKMFKRVALTTVFDMSNYTGSLQLFAYLSKASSTDTNVLTIDEIDIRYEKT